MTTFDLTEKEFAAAKIFVQSCLNAMGGKRPSDLEYDEFTWISIEDLMKKGYSRHEAAGLMSALSNKGFIYDEDPEETQAAHWVVETSAWQWMDKHWD